MKSIWHKLKALRGQIKRLNQQEFHGVSQRIENSRLDLRYILEQLAKGYSDSILSMEREYDVIMNMWK